MSKYNEDYSGNKMKDFDVELRPGQIMRDITKEAADTKKAFEGGATRTKSLYRYDLIPAEATQALAMRYGLGAEKHGDSNWKHGGVKFIQETISHLQTHIDTLKLNGNVGDDNIGAILWAGAALAWFNKYKRTEFDEAIRTLNEVPTKR